MPIFQTNLARSLQTIPAKGNTAGQTKTAKLIQSTGERISNPADDVFQQLASLQGFSAIPNLLIDHLRGILSRNEYDVFMYIVRRTLCFHKLSDAISMSQFQNGIVTHEGRRLDYGCGIKGTDTITRALRALENRGFITREQRIAANGAAVSNVYSLCPDVMMQALSSTEEEVSAEQKAEIAIETGEQIAEDVIEHATTENKQLAPVVVLPLNHKPTTTANYSPKTLAVTPPDSIDPSQNDREGLPQTRGDRIKLLQNKNQKPSKNQHGASLVDLVNDFGSSDNRIELDTNRLLKVGFDRTNALRLALLAVQHDKSADYVTGIISYSTYTATSNPAGMIKYLIERGEERSSFNGNVKSAEYKGTSFSKVSKTKPNFAKFANNTLLVSQTAASAVDLAPLANRLNLGQPELANVWRRVCEKVGGKLNQADLAAILPTVTLVKVEDKKNNLECYVRLAEAWYIRLFTPSSLALIELALSQQLAKACSLQVLKPVND